MKEKFIIKLAVLIISAILPSLREKAKQSQSPIDDMIVEIAQAIIDAVNSGLLDELIK